MPWGSCGSASSPSQHFLTLLPRKVGAEGLLWDPFWVPWREQNVQWGAVGAVSIGGHAVVVAVGSSGAP